MIILNNKRGVSLLFTLIFLITLTIMSGAYIYMVVITTKNTNVQKNNVAAFYLAEAAVNKGIWYLENTAPDSSSDGSWRTTAYPAAPGAGGNDPQQESLVDGTYTIWVEDSGANILITGRGTINNIQRTIQQQISMAGGAPEAFNYAFHSTANLVFDGGTNVIVNGDLSAQGTISGLGDITHSGSSTASSTVVTPTVDTDDYEAIADTIINGDHYFNDGDTINGIVYVDGNASIGSSVVFNGTIVATGNVELECQDGIEFRPTGANPAIVADGSVNGNDSTNTIIDGLVYAGQDILFNNTIGLVVTGAFVSDGSVEIGSAFNVAFLYSAENPPYFSGGGGGGGTEATSVADSWNEI